MEGHRTRFRPAQPDYRMAAGVSAVAPTTPGIYPALFEQFNAWWANRVVGSASLVAAIILLRSDS